MPIPVSRRGFLKGATGAAVAAGVLSRRADAQSKTLTVWHTEPSDTAMKAVQKVCDKFEQTNPGVKVQQQGIAWADLGPKLYTALAA
jgi:ABC-type glycerol-3-phosphate transport system substrate-binding protein